MLRSTAPTRVRLFGGHRPFGFQPSGAWGDVHEVRSPRLTGPRVPTRLSFPQNRTTFKSARLSVTWALASGLASGTGDVPEIGGVEPVDVAGRLVRLRSVKRAVAI